MIRMIHDDAPVITSAPDEVIVVGPETVDFSLTPRAAMQAGEKLIRMACEARGKKVFAEKLGMRLQGRPELRLM